jgi:hypothetical protein
MGALLALPALPLRSSSPPASRNKIPYQGNFLLPEFPLDDQIEIERKAESKNFKAKIHMRDDERVSV